jgi:hypothetical protein
VLAAAAAFALGAALGHSGQASGARPGAATYGGLPSWLPKAKIPVGRIVGASAEHPWLAAVEGDTVAVRLARGRVLATAVGPAVPPGAPQAAQEDRSADADTSRCSFTVTFAAASGVVPIKANAFTIIDERGHVYDPRVSAAGGGPPPARVAPGHTLKLTLEATLPEGEYDLRWAPDEAKVLVGWETSLELD